MRKIRCSRTGRRLALEQAQLDQQVEFRLALWRLFLAAMRDNLTSRMEPSKTAPLKGGRLQEQPGDLLRSRVDADIRAEAQAIEAEFVRFYEYRKTLAIQRAAKGHADANATGVNVYTVEDDLLQQLDAGANGQTDPQGRSFVPDPAPGSNGWNGYWVPEPEGDPLMRQLSRRRSGGIFRSLRNGEGLKPKHAALFIVLLWVVAIPLMYLSYRLSLPTETALAAETATPPPNTPTTTPTATVVVTQPGMAQHAMNNLPTLSKPEMTDPAQLELVRQGRVLRVEAASADNDLGWSTQVAAGSAAWLQGTKANVVFVLPPAEQAAIADMRPGDRMVIRSAAGDARGYVVQRRSTVARQQTEVLEQTRSGITLVLAGVGGNAPNSPRTVVEGIWRPTQTADLVQGDVRGLGDVATVQLSAVHPITSTQPLPPGMREVSVTVTVTNLAAEPLPLDSLIDALQVAGQFADVTTDVARPTVPPGGKADVPFRYLVPDGAAQAVWHIERRAGERAAIPVELPPARSH